MPVDSPTPPEVFISYSSKDKRFKEPLLKQLKILAQQGIISTWHDGLLIPGQPWNEEIIEHLNSSRIILLLISPDFLTSDYVNNVELKLVAERHMAGKVCVIPVLVRNVHGWESQPFGNLKLGDLQALPVGKKFIDEWDKRDKACSDVAQGIQKAVEQMKSIVLEPLSLVNLPPPPLVDFVARKGRDGRGIIERLKEEFRPPSKRLVALIGDGGVGKTTLAAEATRALASVFKGRAVWSSAEDRRDFNFSTLLDEITVGLGKKGLSKPDLENKEREVLSLIAAAPTLVVLDNFETISTKERTACVNFLAKQAKCPALITSRQHIDGALPIYVDVMRLEEAGEFLEKLIGQMQDPTIFSTEVCRQIIETAEARPYLMQWVMGQIDMGAQEPSTVFEELSKGEGDAAEHVFDRSFNLEQLGDDGRTVLLALSLFVSSATREALAEVAGFENDLERVNEAIRKLRALLLIKGRDGYRRLIIERLTRSFARARFLKDKRSDEFRERFVAYFLRYAKAHAQPASKDFNALEAEKGNVLGAMDVAFDKGDWSSMVEIADVLATHESDVHVYEEGVESEQTAGNKLAVTQFAGNAAAIRMSRDEYDQASRTYGNILTIFRILGSEVKIAWVLRELGWLAQTHGKFVEARGLYRESLEIGEKLGDQTTIAITSHRLAMVAQAQGELAEARRLYHESLKIKRKLGNQIGIANTLGQLGLFAAEEGNRDQAVQLLREAFAIFEKQKSPYADITRRKLKELETAS